MKMELEKFKLCLLSSHKGDVIGRLLKKEGPLEVVGESSEVSEVA